MSLRVVKLVAENVKGLKAVDITPDEHFQVISGKNGQGKSSVLDAIWYALGGADALKGTDKPIRNGEDHASVMLDLGDMVVTRKWKGANTTLSVNTKDGAKYSSPQTMLDSLVGRLSFDPFSFTNMKDYEQKKTLMEMVDLTIDPNELDRRRKEIFDQRTLTNREADRLKGQLSGLKTPIEGLPTEEISAIEVMAKIENANKIVENNTKKRELYATVVADYRNAKYDTESIQKEIADLEKSIIEKRAELVELEITVSNLTEKGTELKAQVDALEEPDFDALKEEMNSFEKTNQQIRDASSYRLLVKSIDDKKKESETLTQQIAAVDKEKQDALAAVSFPIDGLGFDESGVTFNGIPFQQCSKGERLKVSMAMAMAMNPKLRVIRILDASLLDEDNLKLIEEMANENDYQVWVEMVDASGKVGIYIENGEVKIQEPEGVVNG